MNVSEAVLRSKAQLPIVKIHPGVSVEGVLGDVGPLWYTVHWAAKRQHLCSGSVERGCPLCGLSQARVIGLTICVIRIRDTDRPFLLEVSPLSWSNFEGRCRFDGLVLGDGVGAVISRPRSRAGLRIEATGSRSLGPQWLDSERRLLGGFAVLYGLPLPALEETVSDFRERVRGLVESRAYQAAASALRG